MIKKKMSMMILATVLAGCATTQQTSSMDLGDPNDQSPPLQRIRMSGHDYRYYIHGDPVVAPIQAFSDNEYLYLQLKPKQVPPIPYTKNGELIEYDVMRSIMRLPKEPVVILRLGPRKAMVEHREENIVKLASSPIAFDSPASSARTSFAPMGMGAPMTYPGAPAYPASSQVPSTTTEKKEFLVDAKNISEGEIRKSIGERKNWVVCYAPTVSEAKSAVRVADIIRKSGGNVILRDGCNNDGMIDIIEDPISSGTAVSGNPSVQPSYVAQTTPASGAPMVAGQQSLPPAELFSNATAASVANNSNRVTTQNTPSTDVGNTEVKEENFRKEELNATSTTPFGHINVVSTQPLVFHGGKRISEQVREWLDTIGWKMQWTPSIDLVVPSDVPMGTSDVLDAIDKLSKWLAQEGHPLQFVAYEGNKVLVVKSLEALK